MNISYNVDDLVSRRTVALFSPAALHTKLVFGSLMLKEKHEHQQQHQNKILHEVGVEIVDRCDLPGSGGETVLNDLTLWTYWSTFGRKRE